MNSIFHSEPIVLDVPDATITYYPNFFDANQADTIYSKLKNEIPWQQDEITVYGKKHLQPRLTALFGNDEKSYSYSNIKMQPHPWSPLLQKIKSQVVTLTNINFTTVLLNLYRDGKDSNGWHADNERELGTNPVIASLSFGADRTFQLKHNIHKLQKVNIVLKHGSLLLMEGTTQHNWKHQIPKTAKFVGERINLTFRVIQ